MLPKLAFLNPVDGVAVQAVTPGQVNLADALFGQFKKFSHLLLGELAGVYLRAFDVSVFRNHVLVISRVVSEEQMLGRDTIPNVARMQHAQPLRNRTKVDFPRKPMNKHRSLLYAVTVFINILWKSSVSVLVQTASPKPASIRFNDTFPQPFGEGHYLSSILARLGTKSGMWFNRLVKLVATSTLELIHGSAITMFQGLTSLIAGASRFFTFPYQPVT